MERTFDPLPIDDPVAAASQRSWPTLDATKAPREGFPEPLSTSCAATPTRPYLLSPDLRDRLPADHLARFVNGAKVAANATDRANRT